MLCIPERKALKHAVDVIDPLIDCDGLGVRLGLVETERERREEGDTVTDVEALEHKDGLRVGLRVIDGLLLNVGQLLTLKLERGEEVVLMQTLWELANEVVRVTSGVTLPIPTSDALEQRLTFPDVEVVLEIEGDALCDEQLLSWSVIV